MTDMTIDMSNLDILTDEQIDALLAMDNSRGSFATKFTLAVDNGKVLTNLSELFPVNSKGEKYKPAQLKNYAKLRLEEDHAGRACSVIQTGEMVILVNLENRKPENKNEPIAPDENDL